MKKLAFIALVIVMVLGIAQRCPAPVYRTVNAQFVYVYTNSQSINLGTGSPFLTNNQGTAESVYHTFHFFYSTLGTNGGATNSLYRTLDGSNFYFVTNFVASTASTNWEFQFVGKAIQFQLITQDAVSNGTLLWNYAGQ